MRVTFLGHSCFLVETAKARLLLDPFLNDNPQARIRAADVTCDFVLVSHGHEDHSGDALAVAKANGATIVSSRSSRSRCISTPGP